MTDARADALGEKTLEEGSSSPEKPTSSIVNTSPRFLSRAHLLGPVEKDHGDLCLLACSLVTGMVDAATFSNWGTLRNVSRYGAHDLDATGNTVILGLSTAGLPDNPHAYATTLVSLASFLVGSFLTFRVSRLVSPKGPDSNRLGLTLLFSVQGLFILIAAILASVHGLIPQNPGGTSRSTLNPASVIENVHIISLLPLLGLQSGMQIAASRLLGFNELPVNVLTSTYCDLMGDNNLFGKNNVKRNRRAVSAVLVLVGAVSSGWLMRSNGGLQSVFWVAGAIKVGAGLGVLFFFPTKQL